MSKQFVQTNTERIIGTVVLLAIFVVIYFLLPKKSSSKVQSEGWLAQGLTSSITLNNPKGNYLISNPSRESKFMTINLPKGSTGDRLRIANETSSKFSAFLGPESIMLYTHVVNFGNKGDVICDNTKGLWQCNKGGVENYLNGSFREDTPSIAGVLWTIVNGGLGAIGGELFGLALSAFAIPFGGTSDSGLDVQALITEFSSIVQSELNTTQIQNIQNSYSTGAQQLAVYINGQKYQQALMNREYADGGDPSILNSTQRTALDTFITHFITDVTDGSLNKSINDLMANQTGPDANGFYTWTLGNNWLLLTTLLTLYWSFVQEASLVDKDNKTGSNYYVPWRSKYISTLQDISGPFVNGCKAAFAMWQDFKNRYMANITQSVYGSTPYNPNGDNEYAGVNIVRDNNTLANGTCIPPFGPPPPFPPTPLTLPTTFVSGSVSTYTNGINCTNDITVPSCVTAAWDAGNQCANPLWTPGSPPPDPQLQSRANDLEYYYSNPTDTITGLLLAAGYNVSVQNNVITYSDAPNESTPSWWGIGPNVPRGTPFGHGWTVNSNWHLLCVDQCTKQGTTCSSGGPFILNNQVTANKCIDQSVNYFGNFISPFFAESIFDHESTMNNDAIQSSAQWGMPPIPGSAIPGASELGNSLFTCVTNEGIIQSAGLVGSASGPVAESRRLMTGLTTGLPTNPVTIIGYPLLDACVPCNFDSFSATMTSKSRTAGLTTFTFSSASVTFWKYKNNPITIESDSYGSDNGTSSLTFNTAEWSSGTFTAKHSSDSKYTVDQVVTVSVARVY